MHFEVLPGQATLKGYSLQRTCNWQERTNTYTKKKRCICKTQISPKGFDKYPEKFIRLQFRFMQYYPVPGKKSKCKAAD